MSNYKFCYSCEYFNAANEKCTISDMSEYDLDGFFELCPQCMAEYIDEENGN